MTTGDAEVEYVDMLEMSIGIDAKIDAARRFRWTGSAWVQER